MTKFVMMLLFVLNGQQHGIAISHFDKVEDCMTAGNAILGQFKDDPTFVLISAKCHPKVEA